MSDTCAELNRMAGIIVKDWEEETCSKCGVGLGYTKDTPISERPFYLEGSGDFCYDCYMKSHAKDD